MRRPQKLVDPFGFRKSLIDAKPDFGREFQVDAARDFAPDITLVAVEGLEHVLHVASAERHDVDRGEPQIGTHVHFRNRDHVVLNDRVMDVAARQHVGELMPDQFAGAQRALRAAAGMIALVVTGHFSKPIRLSAVPGRRRRHVPEP